jgi:hypothetical protein
MAFGFRMPYNFPCIINGDKMRVKKEKAVLKDVSLYPKDWEALKEHAIRLGIMRNNGKPNVSGMIQRIIDDWLKMNGVDDG